MSLEGVRAAYLQGVRHPATIEPEAYWLDAALLARPGMMALQADLKLDYKSTHRKKRRSCPGGLHAALETIADQVDRGLLERVFAKNDSVIHRLPHFVASRYRREGRLRVHQRLRI